MAESLDEWIEKNKAQGLERDLAAHIQEGAPEDFVRLAMISVRQWAEERYGKKA